MGGEWLNYFLKPTFEACISGHTSSGPHSISHVSEVLEKQKLAQFIYTGHSLTSASTLYAGFWEEVEEPKTYPGI